MKVWRYLLLGIVLISITLVGLGMVYVSDTVDKAYEEVYEDLGSSKEELGVNEKLEEVPTDNKPLNIALFGLDCRTDDYEGCRSDAMMILSYLPQSNEVLATSIPRDTYVDIEGYGLDKINHAYAFGGQALSIQTLNRTFDLDIEHYVTLDFWAVEQIVDAVGGVMIDVTPEEFPYVNSYLEEQNKYSPDGHQVEPLTKPGKQLLNGRQAVGYTRIRYVGNGDFERMERQRRVMKEALNQLNNISEVEILKLLNEIIPAIRTNLPKDEIIDLVVDGLKRGIPEMIGHQVPSLEAGQGTFVDNIYYYVPDSLLTNVELMHSIIYPDIEYVPSDYVQNLNKRLEAVLY